MKKLLSILLLASFSLSVIGCGISPLPTRQAGFAPPVQNRVRTLSTSKQDKQPKPAVEKGQIQVTLTEFDKIAQQNKDEKVESDPLFTKDTDKPSFSSPFDNPFEK